MILHITTESDWERAVEAGEYRGDTLDSEGFIHCSAPGQILGVAEAFYRGRDGLVLLGIDPERVAAPIRWEALNAPEEFPHIYGPLNLDAVVRVWDFAARPDGGFVLPDGAAGDTGD